MGFLTQCKVLLSCGLGLVGLAVGAPAAAQISFSVTLPRTGTLEPVTGRLIVVTAKRPADGANSKTEPREAIGMNGPPAFGMDVENLRPGETVTLDATSDGFPFGLDQLPAGDYRVQAVLTGPHRVVRSDC